MASLSDSLVRDLLEGRYIATFATSGPSDSIHMVAVWYWFDGANVFVATSSRSRKARNLQSKPGASLMIDSRDPAASFGMTITGITQILTGDASRTKNALIHKKYLSQAAIEDPGVGPVFAGWDDITVQVTPTTIISWDMREADRQVFGSAFERNPGYLLPLRP